ncbi:MAG: GDP-L-fucose synthase [Pyrinomonadaceae bacterium]|nr:GDP-L-fucose synthase [Pyrinomonadaceae bacterium]
MSWRNKKIYIAGSGGMVGSAVGKNLESKGYNNLVRRTSKELNLINQAEVESFFEREKPAIVILSAAKVGGILANNHQRADFIYDNLMIEANVIQAAFKHRVEKLIFLGSSCIYPKNAPQPIKEEYLLSGLLEYTNEPYAVAKIAGVKLCESFYRQHDCDFFSVMPTNLYGERDNFDLQSSHVIPALIRKFHEAKTQQSEKVILWGSGTPRREFLYVDDLADAVVFLLENMTAKKLYEQKISHINIGAGVDVEISELANIIKEIVGYKGKIDYDATKPDGTPRKLMDVSRLNKLGWKYTISLEDGLRKTYDWFLKESAGV